MKNILASYTYFNNVKLINSYDKLSFKPIANRTNMLASMFVSLFTIMFVRFANEKGHVKCWSS